LGTYEIPGVWREVENYDWAAELHTASFRARKISVMRSATSLSQRPTIFVENEGGHFEQ